MDTLVWALMILWLQLRTNSNRGCYNYIFQYKRRGIRIGTIDKFQGQEDEVTIISLVRSNSKLDYHESTGFVNIPRSCVAFSRSKRKTIIVGDRSTLIKSNILARSIDTITSRRKFIQPSLVVCCLHMLLSPKNK